MHLSFLDERPIIVAVAGPNGAGKTTFYHAHLQPSGLLFVNADVIAEELNISAYEAAKMAEALRRSLVDQRTSFVFETVFSDPKGEKLALLLDAAQTDYTVVLIYVGVSSPRQSEQRIAMRVTQGGHDVPAEKVRPRYERSLENLERAIVQLPHVIVFDNSDLSSPFRLVAVYEQGEQSVLNRPAPRWLPSV